MLTNIGIKKDTRTQLRHLGRKEQTYDDIINELLEQKRRCSANSTKLAEQEKL